MKQILVAGGTGGVGEGIVRALLDAGHRVIVPSRSTERLDRLRRDVGGGTALTTFTGAIGTIDGARTIRDRIASEIGRLDVLIPSLGGWWEGGLLDTAPAVWDAVMDEMLRTHYVFAHVFMPVIRAQTGGGALHWDRWRSSVSSDSQLKPRIHRSRGPTHADSGVTPGDRRSRGRYPRTRGRRSRTNARFREHRWARVDHRR
jgi:NAD(P)-dependent dehydrogenase (short-subunit alcohol dehydrogenase family)